MAAIVLRDDRDAYAAANIRFHTQIYQGAHNEILSDFATGLRRRLAPFRRAQFRTEGRISRSHAEHAAVVKAIVDLHLRDSRDHPFPLRPVLPATGKSAAGGSARHNQGSAAANLPASGAEMDLRPVALRRARPYLLLPVLRSGLDRFANMSVFEFDPADVLDLQAHLCRQRLLGDAGGAWAFENGWERASEGATQTKFRISRTNAAGLPEQPGYFKKESLQSPEMDSDSSVAISAISAKAVSTPCACAYSSTKARLPAHHPGHGGARHPFCAFDGTHGSLSGIAVAIAVAIVYWVSRQHLLEPWAM